MAFPKEHPEDLIVGEVAGITPTSLSKYIYSPRTDTIPLCSAITYEPPVSPDVEKTIHQTQARSEARSGGGEARYSGSCVAGSRAWLRWGCVLK